MIRTFEEIQRDMGKICKNIAKGVYNIPEGEHTFDEPLYTRIAVHASAFGVHEGDEYIVAKCKLRKIYAQVVGTEDDYTREVIAKVDYTLTYRDVTVDVTGVGLPDLEGEILKAVITQLAGN